MFSEASAAGLHLDPLQLNHRDEEDIKVTESLTGLFWWLLEYLPLRRLTYGFFFFGSIYYLVVVPLKEQRQVALSAVHNIHAAQGHTAFKVLPMLVYSDRISGDTKSSIY